MQHFDTHFGIMDISFCIFAICNQLGGGFKHVLFSPLLGEMIQFDEHNFSNGLVSPPTRKHGTPRGNFVAFFELQNLLAPRRPLRWPRPVWPRQLRILLAAPWVEFGYTVQTLDGRNQCCTTWDF